MSFIREYGQVGGAVEPHTLTVIVSTRHYFSCRRYEVNLRNCQVFYFSANLVLSRICDSLSLSLSLVLCMSPPHTNTRTRTRTRVVPCVSVSCWQGEVDRGTAEMVRSSLGLRGQPSVTLTGKTYL